MLIGYMRVSTDGDRQTLDLQRDALLASGVDERHLLEDRVSGAGAARVGLTKALAFMKPGDCLVVWKLDRLRRICRGYKFLEENAAGLHAPLTDP
jgi:DNA invertase Pin-like site-specific DNA recombinase